MKLKLPKWIFKPVARVAVSLLLMSGFVGCVGGTPTGNLAAPPAPIAEIPPSLRFPETIAEIKVGELQGSGSKSGVMAALAIGDNISGDIEDTATTTIVFYDLVDQILEPLHQMIIPVGLENHFEDFIIVGSRLINVKIDFSDFGGRGCSGHTAALPICFRIWLDDERAFFGQFNDFPTDTNAGAGELIGTPPFSLLEVIPFDVSLDYDFRDSLNKSVDIAVHPHGESETESRDAVGRVTMDQAPNDGSFLKTNRITNKNPENQLAQSVSRWIDNQDFWSGTKIQEEAPQFNYEAACAMISTGTVVERQNCLDRGIDVGGLAFAPLPALSEFAFPPDFPADPTF